jgi:hypothetical protein
MSGDVRARMEVTPPRTERQNPAAVASAGFALALAAVQPEAFWNENRAMSFRWNSAPVPKRAVMVSGAYLRQQAEILIAMSRATLDLGIAGRLRQMASELQDRAAEQENEVRVCQ